MRAVSAWGACGNVGLDHSRSSPFQPQIPRVERKGGVSKDRRARKGKEGPFAYRIRVLAGYKVPPHTHPGDENITVISGTLNVAMGDKFDESKGPALNAAAFSRLRGDRALRLVRRADRLHESAGPVRRRWQAEYRHCGVEKGKLVAV